jgi:hypothetical protein
MANTTTAVLESLKYAYGVNRVLYLFNQESVTFNILLRVKKPVGGRGQFIMPIMVQNPGAFAGIGEGGSLPTALDADTAEATFNLQEYVGVYTLSWKLIQDSRNDKFAFQQAVTMLDDGAMRRFMRNLNSDLLDNGKGRLAISRRRTTPARSRSMPCRVLETGMVCDVMAVSDDDTARGDSLTVTGVDPIARTLSFGSVRWPRRRLATTSSFRTRRTLTTNGSGNARHSNGLLSVISDSNPAAIVGNYGGLNRSTAGNEFWKSPSSRTAAPTVR